MSSNDDLQGLIDGLAALLKGAVRMRMQIRAERARRAWPDHQIRVGVQWHPRTDTPPDAFVWASDGASVWLFHGGGKPIEPHAKAVKYWTEAHVPAPPDLSEEESDDAD